MPVSARSNAKKNTKKNSSKVVSTKSPVQSQLSYALSMAQNGQYLNAANSLFALSRKKELSGERAQIKYILGMMLTELKLYQVAAFQFIDVIRMNDPKYVKSAVEKLSIVADTLNDDTLLNYAINRLEVDQFQGDNKDMIYFRVGEVKRNNQDFAGAIKHFAKVGSDSSYYQQALFNKGLCELELKQPEQAEKTFQQILSLQERAGVTDTNKVAAQMAIARSQYQNKQWDDAIVSYSKIPRDHFMWHEALFEQTWAMLRGGRYRSVLSNFHSIHSAYYDDRYIPESLLLRSIVYLYICKYDEMEKVLTLFEKTYGPVNQKIRSLLNSTSDSMVYYNELEKRNFLPLLVVNNLKEEGDIRRASIYLKKVMEEKERIERNQSLKTSPLGQYGLKIIANRTRNTKLAIGDMAKVHLQAMRDELKDFYEQASLIRYEMINGRKEEIKKRISGKVIETQVDEKVNRQFYVENGYEYYPFQGEYWLDEIGNYHYLGKQSCE